MSKYRKWSYKEIKYFKENYGNMPLKNIAKKLNRSVCSLLNKRQRLKLGGFVDNAEDYITLNSLIEKIGISSSYLLKIKKFNFPIKTIEIRNSKIRIVYINQFLKWLEKNNNKHLVDFSNLEKGDIFAIEPNWFDDKRKADIMQKRYKTTKWTKEENDRLIFLCKQYKYSYKEISYKMNRLESAIKRQLFKLNTKLRPLRTDNHDMWKIEEIELVKKMYKVGYKPDTIKDFLPKRGALAIQGLLERHKFFI